eukprot:CAMPEP_0118633688 /NCGR_PEP_ID=MMETSP0785-20121206/1134_1 /TAXON_ID=91992 /ORGANISM="Bolidomonas pacifica, Strain CCMP 1866" /LENGTH=151 /DNA_ID=CAMNT_0006524587 /DNA_START=168 /DNA_END=620 /DNA_ORIENTATION=+
MNRKEEFTFHVRAEGWEWITCTHSPNHFGGISVNLPSDLLYDGATDLTGDLSSCPICETDFTVNEYVNEYVNEFDQQICNNCWETRGHGNDNRFYPKDLQLVVSRGLADSMVLGFHKDDIDIGLNSFEHATEDSEKYVFGDPYENEICNGW